MCHMADAVLAGGIRRSAMIAFFDKNDKDIALAKTGQWWIDNPQRSQSNNSAVINRHTIGKREFEEMWKTTFDNYSGEPGIYAGEDGYRSNPCITKDAPLLTPKGIVRLSDIEEGDVIWSKDGWTTVVKIWDNGEKDVYRYQTTFGYVDLTENHKVVSGGEKVEISLSESIDLLRGCSSPCHNFDNQYVVDGLVIGDGTKHGTTPLLVIGENDKEYFDSEISEFIGESYAKYNSFKIKTKVLLEEIEHTYNRKIPERYITEKDINVKSFLRGLFSANGSVCGGRVTLKQTSREIIDAAQLMLNSVGIASYITENKEKVVRFENGDYTCKKSYDLNITRDKSIFYFNIGFIQKYKMDKLEKFLKKEANSREIVPKNIVSSTYLGKQNVYDITVDNESHTYWLGGFNVSNCGEVLLKEFQFCNLCEINASNVEDLSDYIDRVKAATILGTIQAALTDFTYLRPKWQENTEEEALLGIGMTGLASNKVEYDWMYVGAMFAKEYNEELARELRIKPAARITVIKPSGTTSLVLGCSSGIHSWYAPYYIRRVTLMKGSPLHKYLLETMPELVEDKIGDERHAYIGIPVKAPDEAITRHEEGALDLLQRVKQVYRNWIIPGYNRGPGENNVSATISVKPEEQEGVIKWLWENRNAYRGITVLPYDGGTYTQAPFEEITKERYEELIQYVKPIDPYMIIEEYDETHRQQEAACAGGFCEI